MKNRHGFHSHKREKVLKEYGYVCVYCGETATCVDHIQPYCWSHNNDYENLVASCDDCNKIAGDKIFDNFQQKREYIQDILNMTKWKTKRLLRRSLCTECGAAFQPRAGGSTMFLCTICAKIDRNF